MEFICFKLQRRNLHIRLLLMKTMLIGFKLQRRNLHKVEKDTFFMVGEFQTPTEKFTRNAPRISAVVTAFQTPTEKFTRGAQQPLASLSEVSNSNGEIYTMQISILHMSLLCFKLQRRNLHKLSPPRLLLFGARFKLQRRNLHSILIF